jgi:DNA invertase Pin-like site-specific DNA recombinase
MNCRLDNLEWRLKGTSKRGTRAGAAGGANRKLGDEQVRDARRLYLAGATTLDIADEYGIDKANAYRMLIGVTYSHVDGAVKARRRGCNYGSAAGNAVLDEIDVVEIRRAWKEGETKASLAKRYGVHRNTIYNVIRGETWIHVRDEAELIEA